MNMIENRMANIESKLAVQEEKWRMLGASMVAQTEALTKTNEQLATVNIQLQVLLSHPPVEPRLRDNESRIAQLEAESNQAKGGLHVGKYLVGAFATCIGWLIAHLPEWLSNSKHP